METKKYGGRLEDWLWVGNVIFGSLYDDPAKRFEEGADVRTSVVIKLDEVNNKLETKNSIYTLGTPFGTVE